MRELLLAKSNVRMAAWLLVASCWLLASGDEHKLLVKQQP